MSSAFETTLGLTNYCSPDPTFVKQRNQSYSNGHLDNYNVQTDADQSQSYPSVELPDANDTQGYAVVDHHDANVQKIESSESIRKLGEFIWDCCYFKADVWPIDKIKQRNPKKGDVCTTWRENIDLVNHGDTYNQDGGFMVKFPLSIHKSCEMKYVDLLFTLPKGCGKL